MKKWSVLLMLTAFAVILSAAVQPVKPGEKVLFFGDSITHGGRYIAFFQLLLDSRGIAGTDMMNAGISGGTATGGLRRIQHDVIDRKPDRVFILFGMNDVGRWLYKTDSPQNLQNRKNRLETYTASQKKIIAMLKAAGITPVLMTPTAYDQYQKDEADNLRCNEPGLSDVADIVRKLAKEENLELIELHPYMTDMLKKHPDLQLCGKDLVHPIHAGHMVMALLIADQLGITGPVADVTIPVSGKVQSRFAAISGLQTAPDRVQFRYEPERLAVDLSIKIHNNPVFKDVETIFPLFENLNREMLRVTGLADGTYSVKADDKELGIFSAAQLSSGIDLGKLETPNRARSIQAMKSAWAFYNASSQPRGLVQCRQLIASGKYGTPDPGDHQAVGEALDKWLADHKPDWAYRKYYTNVVNNYKKNAPQEAEMKAALLRARKKLQEDARPVSYTLTIEKVR